MEENEFMKRLRREKEALANLLAVNGYNMAAVEKKLEPQYFSGAISALTDMVLILEETLLLARFSKNFDFVAESLTEARFKKDGVWGQFTKALGTPTQSMELQNGRTLEVATGPGTIECMDRMYTEPDLNVVRRYVIQRYQQGENKCISAIAGN